jgi:hypothetical protein
VIGVKMREVEPLFAAVGSKGLYLFIDDMQDEHDLEQVYRLVDKYK